MNKRCLCYLSRKSEIEIACTYLIRVAAERLAKRTVSHGMHVVMYRLHSLSCVSGRFSALKSVHKNKYTVNFTQFLSTRWIFLQTCPCKNSHTNISFPFSFSFSEKKKREGMGKRKGVVLRMVK